MFFDLGTFIIVMMVLFLVGAFVWWYLFYGMEDE